MIINNNKNKICLSFLKNEWVILTTLFILIVFSMCLLCIKINGPFTFGDESEYRWLSSEIFYFNKFFGYKYNPLYPLIIAPTFYIHDLSKQFKAIKIINISLYASMIFPIYLIARMVLFRRLLSIVAALVGTIGPISGYSFIVWAEPIYYPLICWSYYFIAKYLACKGPRDIFLAGVFVGLSFLAKQAGIILLVSFLIYIVFSSIGSQRKIDKKAIFFISFGAGLIILPWLIINFLYDKNILGYHSMFNDLFLKLKNNPWSLIDYIIQGMSYSTSYWIFIYFGGGLVLLVSAAIQSNSSDPNGAEVISPIAKILLLQSFFLMLISNFFYFGFGVSPMPNGRYADVIYPVAIIVIIWGMIRLPRMSLKSILIIALIFFLILLSFSPLDQREAHAIVHNSGISILNFFWPHTIFWDRVTPSVTEKLLLAFSVTSLMVIILFFRKTGIFVVSLCGLMIGIAAQLQVVRLGVEVNGVNKIFLKMDKKHIPVDSIKIDSEFKHSSIMYNMKFWHPTVFSVKNFAPTEFVDPIALIKKVSIDFGLKKNKAGSHQLKIWAPFNPESGFNEKFGLGFNDLSTLNAGECTNFSKQGDFVFDHNPLKFKFFLPAGNYILRGKSADSRCLGIKSDFIVQAQGGNGVRLKGNVGFVLPFVVKSGERGLTLYLKPAPMSVWTLDEITIESLNMNIPQGSNAQYLLTTRLLPLQQVFNVLNYRLYKIY